MDSITIKSELREGNGWINEALKVRAGVISKPQYMPEMADIEAEDFCWNLIRLTGKSTIILHDEETGIKLQIQKVTSDDNPTRIEVTAV